MKKLLLSFLFLHLSLLTVKCYAQCYTTTWLNPKPTGNGLYSLWMLSQDTVFVAGERGTMLRSTNGGKNWETIEMPTGNQIASMQFVNSKTGYASGTINNYAQVVKTSDGGKSWSVVFDGYASSLYGFVKDVQFLNEDTGYVYFGTSRVLKTTNAGKNWTVQYLPSSGAGCLYFLNTQKGFVGGSSGDVLRTLDGGKSWSSIKISGFSSSGMLKDIYFTDNLNGWAVGLDNEMIRTTDGGQTWKQVVALIDAGQKLFFFSPDSGLALNGYGGNYYFMTTDSGKTWKLKTLPNNTILEDVQFVDTVGYAVSVYGEIYKSTDKGLTWKRISQGVNTSFYSMANDKAGNMFVGGSGAVYKSTDKGQHWDTVFKTSATVFGLSFADSLYGWMDGTKGLFRRTTDGGKTWKSASSGLFTTQNFYSLYFTSRNIGYIGGEKGALYYTTDGGNNWTGVTTNTTENIGELYFIDDKTGYAGGSNGLMMRTTDGGKNWKLLKTGKTAFIGGIWFMNAARGYAAGESGLLLSTTDSGNHWTATYPGWGDNIQRLYFVSDAVGYMIQSDYNGIIYSTADSGKTWQLVASPTVAYLYDLTVLNGDIFVCGTGGKLLKISHRINPPVVHDQTRCGAGVVQLVATAQTFSTIRWYDGPSITANLIHTGDTLLTPSLSLGAVYYASAYDTVALCEGARVPVKAVIHPVKKISLSISASKDTLCAGAAVQFQSLTNADHVLSYTWKRNAGTVGKDSSALGLTDLKDKDFVWLQIRTADECQNDSLTVSGKKTFKVSALPKAGLGINNTEQCFRNHQFIFSNTSASVDSIKQRNWTINGKMSSGLDTVSSTFTKPGVYPVKLLVVNKYGCKDSIAKTVKVFKDPQTGNVTGESVVMQQTTHTYTVPATSGSAYNWWVKNGSGSSTTSGISITWTDTGAGNIKVLETSGEGCKGDTVRMAVKVDAVVAVRPVSGKEGIHIFPSPASGWLHIQTDNSQHCAYSLYELTGRFISGGEIKNGTATMDIQLLPNGIYLLRLENKGNSEAFYQCLVVIQH